MPKPKKNSRRKLVPPAVNDGHAPSAPLGEPFASLLAGAPVYVNSIAAALLGLDHGSILREMAQARADLIRFYKSEEGGAHSSDDAVQLANGPADEASVMAQIRRVLTQPVDQVFWHELERIYNQAPALVKAIWGLLNEEAQRELERGHRIAAALETTETQHQPWVRARFLAIRKGFIDEWQPRGGIERAMIDMMAQAFSEYLYWAEVAHHRATTEGKILYSTEEVRRTAEATGAWLPPRVSDQDAIEHASQMADRYNRLFLRTLRQLRDLRRYSAPVTINNQGQLNLAVDGGQQVNLAEVGGESQ